MKEKTRTLNIEALVGCAFIGVVLLLIIPFPPILLDLLICFSFVFSLMVLLSVLFVKDPLEFNSLPSLLLFLTLYRLGLNVASTRLILAEGAAGDIIHTFGAFVIKGNTSVGLVLFILLALVNFIVITKGAGRIAEVSARFILEAMPGKQLAIDSDLQRGSLSLLQGKKARMKLEKEADFYGAMDGAAKFIRGDAIASLIITFVNILGGVIIGLFVKGLSLEECWKIYTRLTIGDGLVTQIPALLVSVSAGLMLTSTSSTSLSHALAKQMWMSPRVLLITGGSMFFFALIPGMPFWVIAPPALILAFIGLRRIYFKAKEEPVLEADEEIPTLITPPIEISLGKKLLRESEKIIKECALLRKEVAAQLGIVLPIEYITEHSSQLSFQVKIKGATLLVGEGRENFSNKLKIILLQNAHQLLHRQEVARLIENARLYDGAVVEELIPKKLSVGEVLKVLKNLLRERISIRDLLSILEILADHIKEKEKIDPDALTEIVRQKLAGPILSHFFGEQEEIAVITLDPKVEAMIAAGISKKDASLPLTLLPKIADNLKATLVHLVEMGNRAHQKPVIITNASSRRHLRQLIENKLPDTHVFSYKEIGAGHKLRSIGIVSSDVLSA